MNKRMVLKHWGRGVGGMLAVTCIFAACNSGENSQRSVSDAWQRSESSPPPAQTARVAAPAPRESAPANQTPAATVNGRSISNEWLARELMASHGLDLLVQRATLEAVRQEAQHIDIKVTTADIEAEYDLTLKIGAGGLPDRTELTADRRKQLIDEWRATRGVSAQELRLAMERQALLRRMVAQRLTVNEDALRGEFDRLHGRRVECRHIAVSSLREAERLRARIDAGEDFAVLARRQSINDLTGAKGGLLPAFSEQDETVPGVLREAAFHMQPGQVSNPIKVDGQCHLLKLERQIPPDNVQFAAARVEVERSLRERLTPVEMEKLLAAIQQRMRLRIEDPALRRQYVERLRSGQISGPPLSD